MQREPSTYDDFVREYRNLENLFVMAVCNRYEKNGEQQPMPDEARKMIGKVQQHTFIAMTEFCCIDEAKRVYGEESPLYLSILSRERAVLREFKSVIEELSRQYSLEYANRYNANKSAESLASLKADLINFVEQFPSNI